MRTTLAGITFIATLAGCAHQAPALEAPALLEELRARLDRVRAAPSDKYVDSTPDLDVSALAGLSAERIAAALGRPNVCEHPGGAPCDERGDWFYAFYQLREGSLGGGTNLWLRLGPDGRCTAASWRMSE
jgi:hypothetical protein